MPTDPARQYITDVMAEVDRLTGVANSYKVGGRTFSQNDDAPIVKWKFGRVDHEPPEVVGAVANEHQELVIRIWGAGVDEDAADTATRVLKNWVLLAARNVALNQNTGSAQPYVFGSFDWNEDVNGAKGRSLEGSITVLLPVVAEQYDTVVILQTDHTGYSTNPHTSVEEEVC